MSTVKSIKKRLTKAAIYEKYGIVYDTKRNKVFHPVLGWIRPVLKKGNQKLGKGIYTFSTLAGTTLYHTSLEACCDIKGTCACDCPGCYAKTGRYVFQNVIDSNARNTFLAMTDLVFLKHAILAQIEADHITLVRIHAAGDFVSIEYVDMWIDICIETPNVIYWTYTKVDFALHAFDNVSNCNVVNSIIDGIGLNYGHCDYILDTYDYLLSQGETVYICRCGIDPSQHCENCKGCSANKYVLFIEHSTDYVAASDPLFDTLKALIESQAIPE